MNEQKTRAEVIRELRALLASAVDAFSPGNSESENDEVSAEEEADYQTALDDIKREERLCIREALGEILNESPRLPAITDVTERASMMSIVTVAARILMELDGLAVAKT